jgi:hypothetical protein
MIPVRMTNDFSSSEISPLHFGWHPMQVHAAGQCDGEIRKVLQAEEIVTRRRNSCLQFRRGFPIDPGGNRTAAVRKAYEAVPPSVENIGA